MAASTITSNTMTSVMSMHTAAVYHIRPQRILPRSVICANVNSVHADTFFISSSSPAPSPVQNSLPVRYRRYPAISTSRMNPRFLHSCAVGRFSSKSPGWSLIPCLRTRVREFSLSATARTESRRSDEPLQARNHAPWDPPRSVLLVNKLRTEPIIKAIDDLLLHIQKLYPEVKVYAEDRPDIPDGVQVWRPGQSSAPVDLVITLGGDGTILHAASLFSHGAVPPVLSFSMGTLGFLLPFHIDDYAKGLKAVFDGKATILHRMRLSCSFSDQDGKKIGSDEDAWQVMNEIALHRGSSPHLNTIDIYVDGQHLTESVSDGMIVSTPTGSTAYSLSAGGPIVHPSLSAVLLVPICPRSLSFRPLVFPSSSSITLRIGDKSRAAAGVSVDGRTVHVLNPGESVTVHASPYPVPCINRSSIVDMVSSSTGDEHDGSPLRSEGPEGVGPGREDDWVRDINNLLQYNATFRSKALLRYSRSGSGS
ncbi:ATP-NAD kinase-like domain-containing protein [Pisolithus thermaeus]|nr:ATP-NAD kinase-like domain-containing protein [Pisolithus thermaeus]